MPIGQGDLTVSLQVDTSPAQREVARFANNIPAIKAKFDASGLGYISRQASEFERALGSAQARVTSFSLAAGAVYAVGRAFKELVSATIDVQKELTDINVIFNLSSQQLNKFSANLFGIANLTGQAFKEVTQVALEFSRQGLSAEETLKRTASAMTLVRIAGTDVITSVNAITATLNTFNDVGLDSEAILNKIIAVDLRFAVSGKVIAESLTRSASTAQEAGVSLNSLIGITTALQQITARGGSVIGNSLKSIFQRIQRPEVIDQLNQMGIATSDLNGVMLSADKILANVAKRYKDLSQSQQSVVTQLSAGLFQANQFKAIIADLGKDNGISSRATKFAENAGDQIARRQEALNQTLSAQLQTVQNNLTQFASKAGTLALNPAIQNVFKGINYAIAPKDEVGKTIGEGLLKGLGNYLSGPGLALAGVLIGKFFLQFSTYAAKSLATIIETNSVRYQQEQAISGLLQKTPGLLEKIVAIGGDEVKIQKLLLDTFAQQNAALNQQAAVRSKLLSMTALPGPIPFVGNSSNKILQINTGKELGEQVGLNPKFKLPNFSPLSDSLAEAVNREKAMGVNPSSIKIGTSAFLSSPDNPYGLGVYNTKDEPLGLNQGIQRVVSKGIDPKKAGSVPNFADNPFPFLPSRFSQSSFGEQKNPSFDLRSLVPDSIRYGTPPPLQKFPLLLGPGIGKNSINLPELSKSTIDLNHEIYNLKLKFQEANKNFPKLLTQGNLAIGKGAIPLGASGANGPIGVGKELFDNYRFQSQYGNLGRYLRGNTSFGFSPNINTANGGRLNLFDTIGSYSSQLSIKKLANEERINSLNLGNLLTSFLPNSKYKQAQNLSKNLNQESQFASVNTSLKNQALIGSFIAPLAAGVIQQSFEKLAGKNSTTTRGISAGIGGLGNVASYAALGGTVAGPYGVAAGAGLGLLLELPTVFKAFSDILPDLQRNLDDVKDSTIKINDAFSNYISTSEQLQSIQSGELKATVGQRNQLLQKQTESLNALPPEAQSKIGSLVKAGKLEDVYNVASIYNSSQQQKQTGLEDLIDLIKNPIPQQQNIASQINKASSYQNYSVESPFAPQTVRTSESEIENIIAKQQSEQNKITSTRINPVINGLLSNISLGSGQTLREILQNSSPKTIESVFNNTSLSSKNGQLGNSAIADFLKKQGFENDIIETFTQTISNLSESGALKSGALSKGFSPEVIRADYDNQQDYIVGLQKQEKSIDDLNTRLANLTVSGAEAINKFEINVLDKLSQSLTKLKSQSISQQANIQIAEIAGGTSEYKKPFSDLARQQLSARTQYGEETTKARSDFTKSVGNEFFNLIQNFTHGLQGTGKNKPDNLLELTQNKVSELNSVLEGFFKINNDNTVSLTNKNISTKDISSIRDKIAEKIKELENHKTGAENILPNLVGFLTTNNKFNNLNDIIKDKSGAGADILNSRGGNDLVSHINEIKDTKYRDYLLNLDKKGAEQENTVISNANITENTYQKLLASLSEKTSNLNLALAEAKDNLDSNLTLSQEQLTANLRVLGEQFNLGEFNKNFSNNLGRTANATSFGLTRQSEVSSPATAIKLLEQAKQQSSVSDILSNLNTKTQLGITNPLEISSAINKQSTLGNLANVKELVSAQNDLYNLYKDSAQSAEQLIKALSPFTDINAQNIRQKNTNRAAQGVVTGQDYSNAFFSPFAYNQPTFQKDTLNATQDFALTIKDDLGSALSQVTAGAKNASEAFTDLGLSLARSLANKGIDIGLNSLFGLGFQGLQSAFPSLSSVTQKASGGYIPKFATGGFVNSGSGVRDDVPAFLSGGEFVINKNAVNRIGKNNLDLLNKQPSDYINRPKNPSSFPGITSDNINISPTSANISLANAYTINRAGTKGKYVTSALLSAIGQSSDLNPQNQIKFSREKWLVAKRQAYKQYQKTKSAYDLQQYLSLGQAYLGAAGTIGAAAYQSHLNNTVSSSQNSAALSEFYTGTSSNIGGTTETPSDLLYNQSMYFPGIGVVGGSINNGVSSAYQNIDYSKLFSPTLNTLGNIGGAALRAKGGYIPKFANGGYFGGDTSSDNFKAMVMGGEYIMNPKTVRKYGTNYFNNLNNVSKYASGGPVSENQYSSNDNSVIGVLQQIRDSVKSSKTNPSGGINPQNTSGATNNSVTINISMDSSGGIKSDSSSANSQSGNGSSTNQNKDAWAKTADLIKNQTIKVITDQSRPGGILEQTFQKKK